MPEGSKLRSRLRDHNARTVRADSNEYIRHHDVRPISKLAMVGTRSNESERRASASRKLRIVRQRLMGGETSAVHSFCFRFELQHRHFGRLNVETAIPRIADFNE